MSDQFSPEYIQFILSDEAKGLLASWEPKGGDWYVQPAVSMVPGFLDSLFEIVSVDLGDVYWLPTLWQLLQVIEGAGWRWTMGHYSEGEDVWYTCTAVRGGDCEDFLKEEAYDDLLLAAAKLAVKVVEEK